MTCDDGRVVAFVHGELSAEDEQDFDRHLLTCEACWRAVHEDRVGRLAVEQLRISAPPGLADRVTLAVNLAHGPARPPSLQPAAPQPAHRHAGARRLAAATFARTSGRTRRLAGAVALTTAVAAGVVGWTLADRAAVNPPQIARVAAMMAPGIMNDSGLRSGEHFRFGGQELMVRSYRIDGGPVLVATSSHPFPMPADTERLAGSSPQAWAKRQGDLALYGVNRPLPAASMFLVAEMPITKLPQVAARLHLV